MALVDLENLVSRQPSKRTVHNFGALGFYPPDHLFLASLNGRIYIAYHVNGTTMINNIGSA